MTVRFGVHIGPQNADIGELRQHGHVRALRSLFAGERTSRQGPGVSLEAASCLPAPTAGSRSG
jgi:hypothetical protein